MIFQDQDEAIDITPYEPIFDLVCQSDLTDWCTIYPEQCSYVKSNNLINYYYYFF